MEKIVKSGIKVDFHIHSICSTTKDSSQILKNSNKDNIPLLVRNLNAYGVQMCSITDHDTFDYDLYKALQKYEDDQSSTLVKILPGVEFSVMFNRNGSKKTIHVIALFSDDNENKLKNIEEVLKLTNNKTSYDEQDSFSEQKFIQILSDIDLDVVLIAHQKQTLSSDSKPKQNDANSLGEIVFNEFVTSEYFEAFEFKNKKNELFNNISSQEYGQDLLRFITGSDCHDWSVYPKHDASTNDDSFKHTYFKCLPTFKGVAFALTESNRISLENNFFTVDSNNYIDKIECKINNCDYNIPLSKGINVIIGDNSVGKSLLLHKLTDYYRLSENSSTSPLTKTVINGYNRYLEENSVEIVSSLDRTQIFEFDTQGEIRKKFNLRKLNGKKFFNKKYPPDVNIVVAKNECEKYINNVCNDLTSRFEHAEQIEYLKNLTFLKNDIKSNNVTYIKCENLLSNAIKDISDIIDKVNEAIKTLNELSELKVDVFEREMIQKGINYLLSLKEKYEKEQKSYNYRNKIINDINTVFENITKEKAKIETSEEQAISVYLNKKSQFVESVVDAYLSNYIPYDFKFDIKPIKLQATEYPYLNYKFLKRTSVSEINQSYLETCLSTPLKKGCGVYSLRDCSKESFVEALKKYDEQLKPVEFYKNKVLEKLKEDLTSYPAIINSKDKLETDYSDGINSQIYFDILCGDKYASGIYLIDQPEDDVSPNAIKDYLLDNFKLMSKTRQIILVTHNPQFVVNLDADNVIVLTKDDKKQLKISSGALEYEDFTTNIIQSVADTLDGGIESIRKRWKKYAKNNNNQEN